MGLNPLTQLRIAVAYLGESGPSPWWQSQFTSLAGLEFSQFNFSSTHVSAAIAGATLAARRIHDDRIGRKGTRHLFRFDPGLERAVHREILEADQQALARSIESRESALELLQTLAVQTVDAPEGPVQVGLLGEEDTDRAVVDLAAHYLCGFLKEYQVLPYFTARR
jgi:hypothetical protein